MFKKDSLFGLAGLFIFFSFWQVLSITKWINPLFISSPFEVLKEFFSFIKTGDIIPHLVISLEEFAIGFLIACFFGVLFGIIIGWYNKLYSLSSPLIYGLYSTPLVALIPLMIIWLGLDIWPKVAIVFLGAFFPILINTISAVKNLDPLYVRLGKSFGASDFDILRSIALPSSLPFIVAGLRLAIPRAIIGMIVGEFFVSNKGLGYLITFYGATFQTGKLLAVILMVVILSLSLTRLVELVEKRFEKWKPS